MTLWQTISSENFVGNSVLNYRLSSNLFLTLFSIPLRILLIYLFRLIFFLVQYGGFANRDIVLTLLMSSFMSTSAHN